MSDPNPYEPPETPHSLTRKQVAKRGLGVTAILLLTPVAVVVAGGVSCAAAAVMVDRIANNIETVFWIMLFVFIPPPVIVLCGMFVWAWRAAHRPRSEHSESERR